MMQVRHSIASPESVLRQIQKHYPGIAAKHCELLALGCNDNFKIKGGRNDYVFRMYRLDWWPAPEIDEELRFLEVLHRRKINVCRPVRNVHGRRYIQLQAPEGTRYGALFVYLPGVPMAHRFGPRNANMIQLGETVARIHRIADKLKPALTRWTLDFDTMVTPFLNAAPSVLGHREKDLAYLHKLAKRMGNLFAQQPQGALNFGLCHGDLHAHNVMLQPDGNLAIFDFDWCGYSWRAYDLATVWWSLPRNEKGMSPWRAFLRGYSRVVKLSRQEKALMPWFVVLRQFELLNFHLSLRERVGGAWLNDNYYDFQIGFLRNWSKQRLAKM